MHMSVHLIFTAIGQSSTSACFLMNTHLLFEICLRAEKDAILHIFIYLFLYLCLLLEIASLLNDSSA